MSRDGKKPDDGVFVGYYNEPSYTYESNRSASTPDHTTQQTAAHRLQEGPTSKAKATEPSITTSGLSLEAFSLKMQAIAPRIRELVQNPTLVGTFAFALQESALLTAQTAQELIDLNNDPEVDGAKIRARTTLIEYAAAESCALGAAAVCFGNSNHLKFVTLAIEQLASIKREHVLGRYPALLLLYTTGVASVLIGNIGMLRTIMLETEFVSQNGVQSIARHFDVHDVIAPVSHLTPPWTTPDSPLPWHDHIRACIRTILSAQSAHGDQAIEQAMDIFEFLRMLLRFDLELLPSLETSSFLYRSRSSEHISSFLQTMRNGIEPSWVRKLFGSTSRFIQALYSFDTANSRGILHTKAWRCKIPHNLAKRIFSHE